MSDSQAPQPTPMSNTPWFFEMANNDRVTGIKRVAATISHNGECNIEWQRIKEIAVMPVILVGVENTPETMAQISGMINSNAIARLLLAAYNEGYDTKRREDQSIEENALEHSNKTTNVAVPTNTMIHIIVTDQFNNVIGSGYREIKNKPLLGAWHFAGVEIACTKKPSWVKRRFVKMLLGAIWQNYNKETTHD
jgi:hypothetical protein